MKNRSSAECEALATKVVKVLQERDARRLLWYYMVVILEQNPDEYIRLQNWLGRDDIPLP